MNNTPLKHRINMPLIPEGHEVATQDYENECGLVLTHNPGNYVMSVSNYNGKAFLSIADTDGANWAHHIPFPSAQEAWDAGVAMLIMGVRE